MAKSALADAPPSDGVRDMAAKTELLKLGSSGDAVATWRGFLHDEAFLLPDEPADRFDMDCVLATRAFQLREAIEVDGKVGEATWQAICQAMETAFRDGRFHAGALAGVQAISQVLTTHFPAHGPNPDELPNAAIIL